MSISETQPISGETTVHLIEITDPVQLESLRVSTGFPEGTKLRSFFTLYTAVSERGVLSLVAPVTGYGLWVNTAEYLEAIFEQEGSRLTFPVSMPWSEAPEWITGEMLEREISASGIVDENLHFPTLDDDRSTVIPLDWQG